MVIYMHYQTKNHELINMPLSPVSVVMVPKIGNVSTLIHSVSHRPSRGVYNEDW